MIYVTQGHESSISTEVFLKSFLLINNNDSKNIIFICNRKILEDNLNFLLLVFEIKDSSLIIESKLLKCIFVEGKYLSTRFINKALSIIKPNDILATLPTTKEQLFHNDKQVSGHTELFRKYYKNNNISMIFKNNNLNVLLISDHIAINEIPEYITSELIFDKTETTILNYLKYYSELDQVIFSGINPHVGENGTIGTEDQVIAPAIDKLQNKYKEIDFLGPYSGDVLSSYRNNKKQLLVYMFHDQGLSYFKGINGLLGLNISFGLPFLRLSVDHGTALELNGKGIANPIGCLNLLKESINIHKNLDIL